METYLDIAAFLQLWEIAMALSVARGLITAVENLSVGVERPTNRILDHENRTALHWAAKTGRETSVVHLIEHGAEIEAKNKVSLLFYRL